MRLGGKTTPPLDVRLVSGISALQCVPLLGRTVTIPYIRGSLTVQGVNDLLDFRSGYFRMPDRHFDLPPLSAADNLGNDDYIEHVVRILNVHPQKLTQAYDVRKTLHDRYSIIQSRFFAQFFINGQNFCLRGGKEHRALKISQIVRHKDPDHYVYTENGSKKQSDSLNQLRLENKTIPVFPCADAGVRCHVDKYLTKLPTMALQKDWFYLRKPRRC